MRTVGSPYHLATNYLAGSPVLPPCVQLEVFATPTRRYHGMTFIRPFPPAGPSRVRRLFGTCLGDPISWPSRFILIKLTFGRMPIVTKRFSANTFQQVFALLSIGLPRMASASEAPFSRRTSTSCCWWFRGRSVFFCVGFARLSSSCPETAFASSRTLSFRFPLIAQTPCPLSTPR